MVPRATGWVMSGLIGANDTTAMTKLCKVADLKGKAFEAQTTRVRKAQWRDMLGVSSNSKILASRIPSRIAFRWIKGPSGWAKSPLESQSQADNSSAVEEEIEYPASLDEVEHVSIGDTPIDDQTAVELEANAWAGSWDEGEPYHLEAPKVLTLPPQLLAEELHRAALTFPVHTGVRADNVSPRAFARLSVKALLALARLLTFIGRVGQWPALFRLILIVLLPKTDGGKRPIGLFPSPIRIWMRARSVIAKRWEAAQARPSLYGGAGMGAQRAAWNISFTAEAAATSGRCYGQALLDLRAAIKHGYDIAVLLLSLDAYRCPRTLIDNRICSRLIVAVRGITAGSGFATTELRMLLLDVVDSSYVIFPSVSMAVYVDDITIQFCGTFFSVRTLLARATDHCTRFLEEELLLEVSASKSVLIGSTTMLAHAAAAACKTKKALPVRHGKLLGVPSGGGRRRVIKHLYDRIRNFKGKVGRIHALRRMGIRAASVTRAAGTPAVTYGVEITGMSDSHLLEARRVIAKASAPEGGGKDPNLVLYLLDGPMGTLDPAFDAHVLPMQRYATAVWQSWQPLQHLQSAFRDAQAKLLSKGFKWACVSGPIAALIMSLRRLEWVTSSPTLFSDDIGQVFDLRRDPPIVVAAAVRASVRRWRIAQILHKYPASCTQQPDYVDPRVDDQWLHTDGLVPQGTVDLVGVVSRLCKSSGNKSKEVAPWEVRHSSSLISAATGGQWCQARVASTKKWSDDPSCQLCKHEVGTLLHRRYCNVTCPAGGWPQPEGLAAKGIGRLADRRHAFALERGIVFPRIILKPAPTEHSFTWLLEPPDCIPESATWYIDGSCTNPRLKQARCTGFAIVIVRWDGTFLAAGNGHPPGWINDSGGAEVWAFLVVLSICFSCPRIVTDCFNILNMLMAGRQNATDAMRPLARVWSAVYCALEADDCSSFVNRDVIWMPAHCSVAALGIRIKSDGRPVSALDWRGNRLADYLARLAAQLVSIPNLAVLILEQFRRATEYCAASLGVVTHAANNHSISVIREDGKVVNSRCRDNNADHNPHRRKGKRLAAAAAQEVTPPSKQCKVDSVTALSVATAPGLHVPADPIRRNSTGQLSV